MSSENEQSDTWFTATGEKDGKVLIFRSRIKANVRESDYPNLITIYWHYDTDDESGMPSIETNENQIVFEDALETLDSEALSFLMLVVTGNSRKEWYSYVSDVEIWMEKFNELLTTHSEYPIEIENSYEPNWDLYHNFISGVEDIEGISK